ncbi:uncharacterized protein [Littorina saxatilis]|uniref:Globin n=1 Tax=Littorina saxatilis TaxID=31220 RepID=A0AAN9BNC2_9CAEN
MAVKWTPKPSSPSMFVQPASPLFVEPTTNTCGCCCEKLTSATTTRHQEKSPARRTSKSTLLTGQQRLTILRTWHRLSGDLVTLGIATMNRMIYINSKTKYPFKFRFKVGQQLQDDPGFRQHAFWCIQVINAVVENLDHVEDTVDAMFLEIGAMHAGLPLFSAAYFSLLPDVWCDVWDEHLKGRYSVQAAKAWRRVFEYVESRLVEGYESSSLRGDPEAGGYEDFDEDSISRSSLTGTESEVDEDPSANDMSLGVDGSFLSASKRTMPHSRSSSVASARRSGQKKSTRAASGPRLGSIVSTTSDRDPLADSIYKRPSVTPSLTPSQPGPTQSIFLNFASFNSKSPPGSGRSSPGRPSIYDRASSLKFHVPGSPFTKPVSPSSSKPPSPALSVASLALPLPGTAPNSLVVPATPVPRRSYFFSAISKFSSNTIKSNKSPPTSPPTSLPKSNSDPMSAATTVDGGAPCTVVGGEGTPVGNRSRAGSFPPEEAGGKQKPENK